MTSTFVLIPFQSLSVTWMKFQRAQHTHATSARKAEKKLSPPLPHLPPPSWMSADPEELPQRHSALSLPLLHRPRSASYSSYWPPKMLRSSACRRSCWPEAAQPTTAQREVQAHSRQHAATRVDELCVCLSTRITATSNQPVSALTLHWTLRCLTLCCPLL